MLKELLDLAKKSISENWDAYKIASEAVQLQKEADAKIALDLGSKEISNAILSQ